MTISSFIGDHTLLIGFTVVLGFLVWKFIIEPISNEGKPIEPTEEDLKTFGEQMQESINPNTDI